MQQCFCYNAGEPPDATPHNLLCTSASTKLLEQITPQSQSLHLLIPSLHLRRIRLRPRHRIRRRLLQHLLLPRHPRQPIQEQRPEDIKDDKHPHDAEVPPPGRILAGQLREVDVRVGGGAEVAFGCGGGVGEIAAHGADVVAHVLPAGLVGGWVEGDEFDGGADDLIVGETGGEEA